MRYEKHVDSEIRFISVNANHQIISSVYELNILELDRHDPNVFNTEIVFQLNSNLCVIIDFLCQVRLILKICYYSRIAIKDLPTPPSSSFKVQKPKQPGKLNIY